VQFEGLADIFLKPLYHIRNTTVQMVFIHENAQRKYAPFVNGPLWNHTAAGQVRQFLKNALEFFVLAITVACRRRDGRLTKFGLRKIGPLRMTCPPEVPSV